jgi:hypothetical protein
LRFGLGLSLRYQEFCCHNRFVRSELPLATDTLLRHLPAVQAGAAHSASRDLSGMSKKSLQFFQTKSLAEGVFLVK